MDFDCLYRLGYWGELASRTSMRRRFRLGNRPFGFYRHTLVHPGGELFPSQGHLGPRETEGNGLLDSGSHAPRSPADIRASVSSDLAENWNRFSFCWDMFLYRRQNATWGANSDSATLLTIGLGWSRASWRPSILPEMTLLTDSEW